MSWFDSSFSFAKTALSQAQRSIDRVLDIKEEEGVLQGQSLNSSGSRPGALSSVSSPETASGSTPVSPSLSTPSTIRATNTPANDCTDTPTSPSTSSDPKHASKSPFSSWFQTKETKSANTPQTSTSSVQPQHSVSSPDSKKTSDSFGSSTWASGDSYWSTYFGSPELAEKKTSDKPVSSSSRGSTKTTSSRATKKPPAAVTPSRKVENSERGATPIGLKSPTLTSTPITEPATKSTSNEKEEESKPEPGNGQTAAPGELKEHGAKHPKSTKVAGRSQGGVNAKSKGALQLKRRPPSSSVTAPETPSPAENRSEANTNVGGDTEDGDRNADLPGSSTGGRYSADGGESKRSKRAESDHLPSSTKAPIVEDSSAVKESSKLPPEEADGKQKETSLKHGSDQKDGFLSGSVGALEYVTQAVLQDSAHTTGELKQSTEVMRGAGSSSSTEKHPEETVASSDGTSVKDRDQTVSFNDVQLQECHESLPAVSGSGGSDGSESTSEKEVVSGMQRLTQDNTDEVSEEVVVIQEGEHVASSESEQLAHTTNNIKEKSKPAASSSLSQTASPPSADSATGSAVTVSGTQPMPFSTCNEGSLQTPVSAPPTDEQKRGSTSSETALSSSPWQPSSSQETTAVPPVTKEKEKEGEEGEQPLIDQEELEKLRKELARVSQVLEVRESRMVDMSRENITLTEANQTLKRELEEALRTGQSDIAELREEFTHRIASLEKKLQTVIKERDSLRKQLQALQNEQKEQKKSAEEGLIEVVREKEEQIVQLMDEGEKLSIQQLQNSKTIKNLRAKLKENDHLLAAQRQQIEDCETEIQRLKELLKKREENERKYHESLSEVNAIAEQQSKELVIVKSERDSLSDKTCSLQSNLDNMYKELAELRKANAVTQSVAQEAALSAEQTAREELAGVLGQQRVEAMREKEGLLMQINELRLSVSRTEQQAAWREDHLRQEIADMQQRLQEAEGRNQELTSTISQATKPLLRQIENLQAAHSTQSANWEKVEANLTQRLVEAQTQLNLSSEKERSAVEKHLTLQSRVGAMETQLVSLRQEKSQLLATLELERAKLETMEDGQQRESARIEALRSSFQQSMEDLRKEKEMLERQLEYERVRLEAESRKACLESQEKERLRSQLANSLSSLNRGVSRQSSIGSVQNQSQSEILEKSLLNDGNGGVSVVDDHTRMPAASASAIEHFQSLLKQKEGELANAQNLVSSLERSRAAMVEDLASLSTQNEALNAEVQTIPELREKLQDVQHHYEALLQMYGEKAEETEELRLDIQDLKSMYRQQIDELLSGKR